MKIEELGEFGLIDHLTKDLEKKNASTICGVGDDCAVLEKDKKKQTLVTTDLLLEGVHFDLTYMPLRHLGYKAVMVNLSDVYAMGGTPRQITVSLGISQRFEVEDIDALYDGMRRACRVHDVDIVGGDTTSSLTGLTISITCIGEVEKGHAVMRSGAKATDLICVSGNLGAAYMGLRLLEREKQVWEQQYRESVEARKANQNSNEEYFVPEATPDFAGREYLIERQLKPEARRDIITALDSADIHPTAMIDISDGLSSELMHICHKSGCGCRVYEEHIPIDYETASAAEEFNMNLTTCALNGGEDYELLFTVPLSDKEKIEQLEDVKMIGYITSKDEGCKLITRDGNEFELKAQGWKGGFE